jgi:hypothetical protein
MEVDRYSSGNVGSNNISAASVTGQQHQRKHHYG